MFKHNRTRCSRWNKWQIHSYFSLCVVISVVILINVNWCLTYW